MGLKGRIIIGVPSTEAQTPVLQRGKKFVKAGLLWAKDQKAALKADERMQSTAKKRVHILKSGY